MSIEEQTTTEPVEAPRDFDGEARSHGWTPKEEFKGDPDRWVDAETFVKRADEVMPFLKKQNAALKREMDDLKRQTKKAAEFYSKAEQRAYDRAVADLQAKMDEAVETGDVQASRRVMKEMDDLKSDYVPLQIEDEPKVVETPDEIAAYQRKVGEWITDSDWYQVDDKKTRYADMQSDMLIKEHGALHKFPGGIDAALAEIEKRVGRKFAEKPPTQTNGGGNRGSGSKTGGKSLADLPPEARAQAIKWDKQGIVSTAEYLKHYQW